MNKMTIYWFFFQNTYSELLEMEQTELMDEMIAIRNSIRCFNQRVDTFNRSTLHYQLLVSMSGESVRLPPQDINKLALHDHDVSTQAKKN